MRIARAYGHKVKVILKDNNIIIEMSLILKTNRK